MLVLFKILWILYWKRQWKIIPSFSSSCCAWFCRPLLYFPSVIYFPGWRIPHFDHPCSFSPFASSVIFLRWGTHTAHSIQDKAHNGFIRWHNNALYFVLYFFPNNSYNLACFFDCYWALRLYFHRTIYYNSRCISWVVIAISEPIIPYVRLGLFSPTCITLHLST